MRYRSFDRSSLRGSTAETPDDADVAALESAVRRHDVDDQGASRWSQNAYYAGGPISIAEVVDYSKVLVPMTGIPERVESAISRGVQIDTDYSFANAAALLDTAGDGLTGAVVRNSDGVLVVACRTDMHGVAPEMWDWWFGWHSVSSQRYRLWHPRERVSASVTEDRSNLKDFKSRYIGTTSFVEERIGDDHMHEIAISFRAPSEFGIDEGKLNPQGTAICARGRARPQRAPTSFTS